MASEQDKHQRPTSTEGEIHTYAELLPNIRTLTVQVTLPSLSNKDTRVLLTAGGTTLSITHDAQVEAVQLPAVVPGRGHDDAVLPISATPTKNLTFRLGLGPNDNHLPTDPPGHNASVVPWMATDLRGGEEFRCVTCSAVLIGRGAIQQWKNLPSDGWAELMEFWHCHKPDPSGDSKNSADGQGQQRGIAPSNQVIVQSGIGLVSPMHFLVHPGDCGGLSVQGTTSVKARKNKILCHQCSCTVGVVDTETGSYKVHKGRLAMSVSPGTLPYSYPIEKWFACQILTASETQGVRRLVVESTDGGSSQGHDDTRLAHLWIFAPDIIVSSSASSCEKPLRVIKILYRDSVPKDLEKPGALAGNVSEGELELDPSEWSTLLRMLLDSQRLLPPTARKMQDWQVGLLRHFEATDLPVEK